MRKRKDDGRRSPSKRKRSKTGHHSGGTRDVEVVAGLQHEGAKVIPAYPSLCWAFQSPRGEKNTAMSMSVALFDMTALWKSRPRSFDRPSM